MRDAHWRRVEEEGTLHVTVTCHVIRVVSRIIPIFGLSDRVEHIPSSADCTSDSPIYKAAFQTGATTPGFFTMVRSLYPSLIIILNVVVVAFTSVRKFRESPVCRPPPPYRRIRR